MRESLSSCCSLVRGSRRSSACGGGGASPVGRNPGRPCSGVGSAARPIAPTKMADVLAQKGVDLKNVPKLSAARGLDTRRHHAVLRQARSGWAAATATSTATSGADRDEGGRRGDVGPLRRTSAQPTAARLLRLVPPGDTEDRQPDRRQGARAGDGRRITSTRLKRKDGAGQQLRDLPWGAIRTAHRERHLARPDRPPERVITSHPQLS